MPMHDWSQARPGTYHNFHYRWIAAIIDQLNAGILPRGCFAMAAGVSEMPMHDWSHVRPGTYHNFHLQWIATITKQLNAGILPRGCFAMAEQVIGGPEPDVVALKVHEDFEPWGTGDSGGTLVLAAPAAQPTTSVVMRADIERYARKANRIVIRHELGEVLAIIELVSPGNKDSSHAVRSIVDKLVDLLDQGINLLVVDPFPPGPRDPQGLHGLIWQMITDEPFELPAGRRLTIASYQSQPIKTAWVEPLAVGMPLPTMPLFLQGESYVNLPLEPSYMETWNLLPIELQRIIEPAAPRP